VRRGTHPVSRSGPGEICGSYSDCSGNTATDNVSSPQQKPLGGYGEDTLIRAGDKGGTARVSMMLPAAQGDGGTGARTFQAGHPPGRVRAAWDRGGRLRRGNSRPVRLLDARLTG
jgi:hypothetical protein